MSTSLIEVDLDLEFWQVRPAKICDELVPIGIAARLWEVWSSAILMLQ